MLRPGDKIFEYEVIRPVGQGGFASVFEAKDRMLERSVAIKQLLSTRATDEKSLKRFVQEARVAASLEHPNVISIFGLRVHEKQLYMIMEYLPGGSLRDLLDKQGALTPKRAVELTIGICEGLAKLHALGVIHRDIKAENILLTHDGRPKVTDFGIAHVPEEAGGLAGLTMAGFQPSTLLYSSPEQLRGEKLDIRSDVYQVGELLYYMLTGEHYINIGMLETEAMTAVGSKSMKSQARLYEMIERAICDDMPLGLKVLWREVGALAGVVEQALSKKRDHRFKNTMEFVAALRAINLDAAPVEAESTSTERAMSLHNSRAHNRRGLTQASMRNYEQAIFEYTQAIKLDPYYAEAYNNLAAAHLMMNNYGQAVSDGTRAIELAPDFVAAYVNRGIAFTGLRDYERAVEDYAQVIELNPKSVYAYYNRGNTYVWMGKYQEALSDFTEAIALAPEFVAAYVNRGVVYDELHNYQAALNDYNHAIKLNPEYSYAYYNRASAHRAVGNHQQAVADYTKVIELNPEHPYAYRNRGDVYAAIGDQNHASDDYARIMIQTSSINPKRLTVARSMLMPSSYAA